MARWGFHESVDDHSVQRQILHLRHRWIIAGFDDGWTWRRGTALPRRGLAPDVIHLGDRYFLYIAANSGPTKADVSLLTNKTLDPDSPDYKWEEGGVVASSDGVEDANAIDPGILLDQRRSGCG